MTKEEKLKYIIEELKTTPKEGVYKVNECIKEKINFYTLNIDKLDNISEDKILKHAFISEVLSLSEDKEKKSYIKRLKNKVVNLERHLYAPELNKLCFKDGKSVKTPQKTTIEEAINYFIFSNSVYQIKRILLNN